MESKARAPEKQRHSERAYACSVYPLDDILDEVRCARRLLVCGVMAQQEGDVNGCFFFVGLSICDEEHDFSFVLTFLGVKLQKVIFGLYGVLISLSEGSGSV